MKQKNWLKDLSLIFIIIVMGVFLFIELGRTYDFMRQRSNASQETEPTALKTESENLEPEPGEVSLETDLQSPELNDGVLNIFTGDHQRLQLSDLYGNPVELADFRGKSVLLNFWATWCPPCLEEMPLIETYAVQHQDELVVLAINAGEDERVVQEFSDQHGFSFNILLDPTNSAARNFFVYGYPTTMFFNEEGYIQSTHIGELNEDLLVNYLITIGIGE